jgi:hypothetical protein
MKIQKLLQHIVKYNYQHQNNINHICNNTVRIMSSNNPVIVQDSSLDPNTIRKSSDDDNMSLEEKIRDYVSKNKTKLYVMTPCYGSLCFVNYVCCIIKTKELCKHFGIDFVIEFCRNDSLVSRARNNLVAKAMADPDMTHMLFIDADITWDPIDVIKLLLADKSLVGGVYPLKNYNWNKLLPSDDKKEEEAPKNIINSWLDVKNNSQFKDSISDINMIQHRLLKYNINYIDNVLSIKSNLARVRHLATGFMMFKRSVIEQMALAYPSTKYVDDVGFLQGNENKWAYALFDCGVEDGHYYSEDWLFCHRWTKMGGNIYIDVGINLIHTGNEDYRGCYIASIL